MLQWLLLLPVWESFGAPLGRWGTYAFPIIGEKGEVYIVDGRRIWRLNTHRWEEFLRLPEEARAGAAVGTDSLVLGGLGVIMWVTPRQIRTLSVEGTGWIYRIGRNGPWIALKGAQASFIGRIEGENLLLTKLQGEWVGSTSKGFILHSQDSLYEIPSRTVLRVGEKKRWAEIAEIHRELWGISHTGEVRPVSRETIVSREGRFWIGPYWLEERAIRHPLASTPLWQSREPIYAAGYASNILGIVTPTECILLYPQAPISWVRQWSIPITQAYSEGAQWVVWQGEVAFFPDGFRKYPTTLIEPALYRGQWLWATPRGLLSKDGRVFAAAGRYAGALAIQGEKIAWASGNEVFIRIQDTEVSYRFPHPVKKLGWAGDTLWAWRSNTLFSWDIKSRKWTSQPLPFQPEDGAFWRGSWYFKVGLYWLSFTGRRKTDTLYHPPWVPPQVLAYSWGRPIWSYIQRETTFVITSLGLLAFRQTNRGLPPLHLQAEISGPALSQEKGRFYLPAERSLIELSWRASAAFLPGTLRAYYQLGEAPPIRLTEPKLIFTLSRPGTVRLRLWIEHPWYPNREELAWEIEVTPPWYETGWARGLLIALLFGVVAGIFYLREWNMKRLQKRLAEERERLVAQTQRQQAQLLQAERMANLGIMAAHIAHEINTPLGVIRSALSESIENFKANRLDIPLPKEPRPSAARMRELRAAWQDAYPTLSPAIIQQLAAFGYTPEQEGALAPYLQSSERWELMSRSLLVYQALMRASEAAERLHARVQAIRTYVRGIEDAEAIPISVTSSLQATIDFYRPMLKKVEVEMLFPEQPIYVCGNPARLEQVWANLIQNALQAMPSGGKLTLRVEKQNDRCLILIQDTGKGIPAHLREAIFEPLFTTKAPGEGTGLGLPLCRQILETYGGSLRLLHSEPGYTLFGVELPICEQRPNVESIT
ncbi:MAG: HAMP domain-containing histidine kinase [Bacteroidia bacterium]|nr:HAMP domain-containing histidine kinase [Bacteroidia bacterium]MCX7652317.1 HAMP domain-containing histidine kinase [Bacteroidia bacterium]MDW8417270.1 HAMP domain-containing sensor histidine kinase [Bacteroidia bacterium]